LPLAEYSEDLLRLPEYLRRAVFQSGYSIPSAAMLSLAINVEILFPESLSQEENIETLQRLAKQINFISEYGEDQFEKNKRGEVQIPDVVWEILVPRLDLHSPQEWGDTFSPAAQKILADVFLMNNDPYPKETPYAPALSRFIFLASAALRVQTLFEKVLAHRISDEEYDILETHFLSRLRTLDAGKSKLESFIAEHVREIEFMLNFEDNPHFKALTVLRDSIEENPLVSANEMAIKLGVKPEETELLTALNFMILYDQRTRYVSNTESIMNGLHVYLGPVRIFRDFHPDAPEEFLVFGLLYPYFEDPDKEEALASLLGEKMELYQVWMNFLNTQKPSAAHDNKFDAIRALFQKKAESSDDNHPENMQEDVKALVLDMMVAHDMFALERDCLILSQNPFEISDAQTEIVHIKAELFQKRDHYLTPYHPRQSQDMRDFRHVLLLDAWDKFHQVSQLLAIGRVEMTIVERS
jgi:hypothetical protein